MSRISWIVAAVAALSLPAASAQDFVGGPTGSSTIVERTVVTAPLDGTAVSAPVVTAPLDGTTVSAPVVTAPLDGTAVGAMGPATTTAGPIHAYSYYIEYPAPARTYVPYGPTDVFSYRGQAYGHAYDRWTWPAMSGASAGVGRYYQILR
jgi:hypothetical protein